MVARVSADILALVEFVIVLHVLLHWLADRVVLIVVHYVSVCDVLGVDAASTFDHWELLGIQILIRIRSKTSTHWFLLILLIIATSCQIWKLLLCFAKLFIMLFLVRIDALDLISTSDFNLCSMTAHVI